MSHKERNKKIKIENGNINSNKLKILLWNKANSNIMNRINEIRDIAIERKPDIIIINEFNQEDDTNEDQVHINGFKL